MPITSESSLPRERQEIHSRQHADALDKSNVAELTATVIDGMQSDELIRVIRASDLPMLRGPGLARSLAFLDHSTLKRLTFLARQVCRNQGY